MNICIYGAGAIGGIMAAWLEQSGHHVSIIARGAHLAAIQKNGLRIHSLAKDRKSTRLNSSHTDISRMPSSA